MRIPSGDLVPARKHRRGPRAYGRRRSRWPAVAAVLAVALLAAGAYALTRQDDSGGTVAQAPRCPSPPAAPARTPLALPLSAVRLPAPQTVRLRLLNGTARDGLARTVGNELARRGFRVAGMGNAPKPLGGASRITFGPGARQAATLVSVHVLGAQLVPAPTAPPGSVDVVLGSRFVRLRTPVEVRAQLQPRRVTPLPAASPIAVQGRC